MTNGKTRWALAALPILAMSFGLTALAAQPIGPVLDLSTRNCGSYPYSVLCKGNHNPGGSRGCFPTLCQAIAAGAYGCKRTGTCEPI